MMQAVTDGGAWRQPGTSAVSERQIAPHPGLKAVEVPGQHDERPIWADLDPDQILDQVSAAHRQRRINTVSAVAVLAAIALAVLGLGFTVGNPFGGVIAAAGSPVVGVTAIGAIMAWVLNATVLRRRRRRAS